MKTKQTSNLISQGGATWDNKQKVQFFLACLLALLASWPRFGLVNLAVDLTVGLAIGEAELMGGKVAVGFLR